MYFFPVQVVVGLPFAIYEYFTEYIEDKGLWWRAKHMNWSESELCSSVHFNPESTLLEMQDPIQMHAAFISLLCLCSAIATGTRNDCGNDHAIWSRCNMLPFLFIAAFVIDTGSATGCIVFLSCSCILLVVGHPCMPNFVWRLLIKLSPEYWTVVWTRSYLQSVSIPNSSTHIKL